MKKPSQIELVAAICKTFGNRPADSAFMNAIIKAANDILAEANRERVMTTPNMGLVNWLASDDTGMSSKYMASVLADPPFLCEFAHPHDGDDFGRCYRMLKAAPELRSNSMRLAKCPAPWPALHEKWLELEKLYEAALSEPYVMGKTPKLDAFYAVFRPCIGRTP